MHSGLHARNSVQPSKARENFHSRKTPLRKFADRSGSVHVSIFIAHINFPRSFASSRDSTHYIDISIFWPLIDAEHNLYKFFLWLWIGSDSWFFCSAGSYREIYFWLHNSMGNALQVKVSGKCWMMKTLPRLFVELERVLPGSNWNGQQTDSSAGTLSPENKS